MGIFFRNRRIAKDNIQLKRKSNGTTLEGTEEFEIIPSSEENVVEAGDPFSEAWTKDLDDTLTNLITASKASAMHSKPNGFNHIGVFGTDGLITKTFTQLREMTLSVTGGTNAFYGTTLEDQPSVNDKVLIHSSGNASITNGIFRPVLFNPAGSGRAEGNAITSSGLFDDYFIDIMQGNDATIMAYTFQNSPNLSISDLRCSVVNLTKIFGAGNEPSLEVAKVLFSEHVDGANDKRGLIILDTDFSNVVDFSNMPLSTYDIYADTKPEGSVNSIINSETALMFPPATVKTIVFDDNNASKTTTSTAMIVNLPIIDTNDSGIGGTDNLTVFSKLVILATEFRLFKFDFGQTNMRVTYAVDKSNLATVSTGFLIIIKGAI